MLSNSAVLFLLSFLFSVAYMDTGEEFTETIWSFFNSKIKEEFRRTIKDIFKFRKWFKNNPRTD